MRFCRWPWHPWALPYLALTDNKLSSGEASHPHSFAANQTILSGAYRPAREETNPCLICMLVSSYNLEPMEGLKTITQCHLLNKRYYRSKRDLKPTFLKTLLAPKGLRHYYSLDHRHTIHHQYSIGEDSHSQEGGVSFLGSKLEKSRLYPAPQGISNSLI